MPELRLPGRLLASATLSQAYWLSEAFVRAHDLSQSD